MIILCRRQPQLGEDACDVLLHRPLGDHKPCCDRVIRAPLGHQLEHLSLALGEFLQRILLAVAPEQLADHLGVDHRAVLGDPVHGIEQGADVGDALLEQITDPLRGSADQLDRVLLLNVLRKDKHPGLRLLAADRKRGT